jgi:hypothetical protein
MENRKSNTLRTFNDSINERKVTFWSDAPQATIDALEFNGEWYVVKEILLDWGYIVIENTIFN